MKTVRKKRAEGSVGDIRLRPADERAADVPPVTWNWPVAIEADPSYFSNIFAIVCRCMLLVPS